MAKVAIAVGVIVWLAIAVAVRCDGCIADHVMDALCAGATRAEMAEAIGVAILMGGGPSVVYGAEALDALSQLETHPKEWAALRREERRVGHEDVGLPL